jgi:diguanylate cyclase (GGDEF)-like protein
MLSCSIVLLATMISFLVYSYFAFNQDSRERLGTLSEVIGADVGAALAFADDQAVSKSLAAFKADESINQIIVLNEQNQVSAFYHQKMDTMPGDLQQHLRELRSKAKKFLFVLNPVLERPVSRDGIRLGSVIIEQGEHVITRKLAATTGISALILLLSLLFSYLLAERFQRLITEPVTAMATVMQEVSCTKDYSKRVVTNDIDEMGRLATHFNEMLAEIERRDITLIERQDELYQLANFDALTGLPNRALYSDRLEQAVRRAARAGERLAVLFIDLDNFKMINDTHGHLIGDRFLQETAGRLAAGTRADDTLARLGGDEFSVFLQDVKTTENALMIARKHVKNLFPHYHIDDKNLFASASVGIAIFPEHGMTAESLLKNADSAMYLAKEKGKNNVELFTDLLDVKLSEKLTLSTDLRKALERGEFELYYQPRINLSRNSWASAEALIRWNHPEMGMISPDTFIPLAVQTGLILPIGEWVLREACHQLRDWHCQGFLLPRISVNVAPLQLQRQDLLGIVKDALASNNLRPTSLELEIVESALMEDMGRSITVLKELRNIGVKISIDDFGTGYSSLSYLHTLPVDILKIDRSFLWQVHESKEDEQIFAAIVAISLSLGLEVVTEGVENIAHEQILKIHSCHEAQGYYYARPLPAAELLQRYLTSKVSLEEMNIIPESELTAQKKGIKS